MSLLHTVRSAFCASLLAAAAVLLPSASRAADYTIKLAYVAQPSNPLHAGMQFFADKVKDASHGRIEVQLFHSGQLGGERDYVEGLQLGTIEMAVTSAAILGSFDKRMNLLSLPFLFRSSDHLDHVLDGPIGSQLAAPFPAKGFRILGYPDFGARYLYDTKRSIRSPAEMRGLKFRAIENPIFVDTYSALGAHAVPMARPEVYSALKEGVLDGLDNSLAFYQSMGDYEVAKYLTLDVQLFQTPAVLMVSEQFFQKLPPDLQKALQDAAAAAVPYERKVFRAADATTLTQLEANGVVVVKADRAPFETAARTVWDKYADQVGGRDLIDAVVKTH